MLTERRGHATELARSAAPATIIAFGGDGVFNEVLNGVEGDRVLGFVPAGARTCSRGRSASRATRSRPRGASRRRGSGGSRSAA